MSSPRIANARSPLAGMFVALVATLVAGISPALATTILQQVFQSSTTLSGSRSSAPMRAYRVLFAGRRATRARKGR